MEGLAFKVEGSGFRVEGGGWRLEGRGWRLEGPLSSEYGIHKTVKARLWPLLEPFSVRKSVNIFKLFPLRSGAVQW